VEQDPNPRGFPLAGDIAIGGLILCVSLMRETRPLQGEGTESCSEQTAGD
jgi:hypothetical protein